MTTQADIDARIRSLEAQWHYSRQRAADLVAAHRLWDDADILARVLSVALAEKGLIKREILRLREDYLAGARRALGEVYIP